jgi:beta-phosphoglucomutase-like phosphatase (HAD superfamily)
LGVTPLECVVVEDSKTGIKAGKNAGMIVIARIANHNQSTNFALADYVVNDLREIPKIISRILETSATPRPF